MERFQQKLRHVMDPRSRLCKGLENVRKLDPEEPTPVPVDEHIKLVGQTMLLLGKASNTKTYGRRLNILKSLMKDPRKTKNMLKERANLLQKLCGEKNSFAY